MLLKVTDNISMIQSELGFTYCNCVLIDDDVRAVIDTGADAKSLTAVSPENIDMVLYTHHHYDHTREILYSKNQKHLFTRQIVKHLPRLKLSHTITLWINGKILCLGMIFLMPQRK